VELIRNESVREKMRAALAGWHAPRAAEEIAESIMQVITARHCVAGGAVLPRASHNLKHPQSAST